MLKLIAFTCAAILLMLLFSPLTRPNHGSFETIVDRPLDATYRAYRGLVQHADKSNVHIRWKEGDGPRSINPERVAAPPGSYAVDILYDGKVGMEWRWTFAPLAKRKTQVVMDVTIHPEHIRGDNMRLSWTERREYQQNAIAVGKLVSRGLPLNEDTLGDLTAQRWMKERDEEGGNLEP